jgi:hypothetical protein
MKRNFKWSMLIVLAGCVIMTACKKDEETPKSTISFDSETQNVLESDGTSKSFHPQLWQNFSGSTGATGRDIQIKIALDRPLAETAVLGFTLGGTATKNSASATGDYEIDGSTVTIEKGATEANITITLFEDFSFEADKNQLDADGKPFESLTITLSSVVSGPLILGKEKLTYTLNIYEDDTVVYLSWDNGTGSSANPVPGDVDMDLFGWFNDPTDGQLLLTKSQSPGQDYEGVFIPAGLPNGEYSMSYTYYSGSSNDVEFYVDIVNFGGNLNSGSQPASYTGHYTLDNVNAYDADQVGDDGHANYKGDPQIVQSMTKNGLNYTNISAIASPAPGTGSRMINRSIFINNRNASQELSILKNVNFQKFIKR